MPQKINLTAAAGDPIPNNREEFLKSLGLPADTTEPELTIILQSNVGTALPFKKAVYTALLAHKMRLDAIPEHEARQYLKEKFPVLNPPDAHRISQAEAAKSLREQLLALYDLPGNATDEDIAQAAADVQNKHLSDKARRAQEEADETVIAQKMSVGITREQATAVIKRQREHDARVKMERDARLPRLLEIIKSCGNDLRAARKLAQQEIGLFEGSEFYAAVEILKQATSAA